MMFKLSAEFKLNKNFELLCYSNRLESSNINFFINYKNKVLPFIVYGKGKTLKKGISFNSYAYSISKSVISTLCMCSNGITSGYFIELVLKGIGFKVFQFNNTLFFQLGYSHFYIYENRMNDSIIKAKRDRILIFGFDRQEVGNIAYEISSLRKPDAYKAKGIQFKNKAYILKEGKKK